MIKTPQFLQRLMSSPKYMDKNSDTYAMVERYLKCSIPGKLCRRNRSDGTTRI